MRLVRNITMALEKLCVTFLGKDVYQQLAKSTNDDHKLKNIIYELLTVKDTSAIQQIIKDRTYGFGHAMFDETRKNQEEQDGFIQNPFDVAEGIFKCGKCGGTRTYSYSKQVRSCDEGMSVFVTCVKCKNKWMHSG